MYLLPVRLLSLFGLLVGPSSFSWTYFGKSSLKRFDGLKPYARSSIPTCNSLVIQRTLGYPAYSSTSIINNVRSYKACNLSICLLSLLALVRSISQEPLVDMAYMLLRLGCPVFSWIPSHCSEGGKPRANLCSTRTFYRAARRSNSLSEPTFSLRNSIFFLYIHILQTYIIISTDFQYKHTYKYVCVCVRLNKF